MGMFISTRTNKSFEEATLSVLRAIDKAGWSVFQIIDMKERLAAKGFNMEDLKIIELCAAKHAYGMISENKLTSLCMPCKINIIKENGQVTIAAIDVSAMASILSVSQDKADAVSDQIKKMIEEAK